VIFKIGNTIKLSGGYDYKIRYLEKSKASFRLGTVIGFIEGQNDKPALVARLNEIISGEKITGDIVVLELRHTGVSWTESNLSVHIELCDFIPENKPWKDRRQGEWIEAAATLNKIGNE
jgi:hypothetical protein